MSNAELPETKLLPCPFCGKEPKGFWNGPYVSVSGDPAHLQFYGIVCVNCCSTAMDEIKERAVAKWNTRTRADLVSSAAVPSNESVRQLRETIRTAVNAYQKQYAEQLSRLDAEVLVAQIQQAISAAPAPSEGGAPKHDYHDCLHCGRRMKSDFDEDVGVWYECENCDYQEQVSSTASVSEDGAVVAAAREIADYLDSYYSPASYTDRGTTIKDVAAIISKHCSGAPNVRWFEAKLLNFEDEWRVKLCKECLRQATQDNFVVFSCALPFDSATPAAPPAQPPTHRCNGVNSAERHGTANKCTVCGEYRNGWFDSNGMEVLTPSARCYWCQHPDHGDNVCQVPYLARGKGGVVGSYPCGCTRSTVID